MKFTLSWLKRHLRTEATIEQVAEAMTLAGLEVEEIINPAKDLASFTIAHVKSAEKHPDADKLSVCQVDTIDGPKQIVCGAPNARAGIAVAYAPMGTYIPGLDFSLDKKPRNIRGVPSSGMMCSADELGLGDAQDGILELDPADHPVGQLVVDALGQNDPVIDFEVTPNRPDWLGVNSIAKDLAATGLGEWITPDIAAVDGSFPCPQDIQIKTEACPTFVGRVVRGVKNGPSPQWLQAQLKAIGLRPISALVDITNFITYDRARPLHFYDLGKLQGPLIIRRGQDGDGFDALDDKSYTPGPNDIVIADKSGALGLGGIVGGISTGVDENTVDILIESAYFDPLTIRRSAKTLGVNSDAKYRFERGVDTGGLIDGAELATQMVLDICGGEASEVLIAGEIVPPPPPIAFDPSLTQRLTGLSLNESEVETILTDLGFSIAKGKSWTVTVPSFRRDIREGADLVEEIARIHGFHNLEALPLPPLAGRREPTATLTQNHTRLARRALALSGMSEAISWSFVLKAHAELFGGGQAALALDNPISAELNWMRPSALIHLILAGQKSADRGYPGAALFELGPVFSGTNPDEQRLSLAGMRRAEAPRDWAGTKDITALTAKADALTALSAMGVKTDNLQLMEADGPYWHPGRSASLRLGPKNILASFGEIHPAILKKMDIEGRIVAFEIWPENLPQPKKKKASKSKNALALSDLMPVHRDFAFITAETVPAGDILRAAKSADKALITAVNLFDIYRGKGVEDGFKSLAIDVSITPKEATLTDKDIDAIADKIITKVMAAGGRLRQ